MSDIKISNISDIDLVNDEQCLFNCGILRLLDIKGDYLYLKGQANTDLAQLFEGLMAKYMSVDGINPFDLSSRNRNYYRIGNDSYYRLKFDSECSFYDENNRLIDLDTLKKFSKTSNNKITAIVHYQNSQSRFTVLQLKSQAVSKLDCLISPSDSDVSDISDEENIEDSVSYF